MAALSPEEVARLKTSDHDTLRMPLIVGHAVCLFVAVVSVILRFGARRLVKTFLGTDDWVNAAGLLITAAFAAINWMLIERGMGRHIWWLNDLPLFVKLSLASEVTYNLALLLIRSSILLLYHRIFPQRWLKWTLLVLGMFLATHCLANAIATLVRCTPMESLWEVARQKQCINYPLLVKVSGNIDILINLAILALPIPLLWRLNLAPARKMLLLVPFFIGTATCAASVARLVYTDKASNSTDSTWDNSIPALITTVELCSGLLASSLPTYRPFVSRLISSERVNGAGERSSKGSGPWFPVEDSLQVPISSHYTRRQSGGYSELDRENVELFGGQRVQKTETRPESNPRPLWNGLRNNQIRVTTTFRTTELKD